MACNKKIKILLFVCILCLVFFKIAAWGQSPKTVPLETMEIMSKSNLSTNTNNLLPLVCISVLGHYESEEEIGSDDLV